MALDVNRVIFEYGKAQLHIIMLQEQLQQLSTKITELTKDAPTTGAPQETEKPKEIKRGRLKSVISPQEASTGVGAAL